MKNNINTESIVDVDVDSHVLFAKLHGQVEQVAPPSFFMGPGKVVAIHASCSSKFLEHSHLSIEVIFLDCTVTNFRSF